MLKLNFKILLIACFMGVSMSCNKETKLEPLPEPVIENNVPKSQIKTEVESKKSYCFRNETPYKENAEDIDILELKLDVIGSSVSGIYNWLPKFKDRREGVITGKITGNKIEGKYEFSQEGKVATIPIQIQLNEDSVIVSDDPNGIGIGATINRTNCSL
tara:strand:- start:26759 stop:27235 length:477 start_codon:yes stop_codon:yes gene_type:complete